jgi:hypothetical protein
MTIDKTDNQVLEEALASYMKTQPLQYDPDEHHFTGFRLFAEDVIGDALRKIGVHAFPKVAAASDEGMSIGAVSLVPLHRSSDGRLCEFSIREGGVDRFVVRMLHTPAGRNRLKRRASDTVVLLRPDAQYGICHAAYALPDEEFAGLRYQCHAGPGSLPGLTDACQLILPFIKDEAKTDDATRKFSLFQEEYVAVIERDGGLPGALTAKFGERVIDAGMGGIYDWIAVELPALAAKVGEHMTWPDNSLVFNDQNENFTIVRAAGAMALVQFIAPSGQDEQVATMQVLRQDDNGKPVSSESYVIPVGEGDVVRAIEAFRAGEVIEGHPAMSFDFTTRRITTTPAFLETKHYRDIALSILHVGMEWKGRRREEYLDGVPRFMEWDGLAEVPAQAPSPPAL